MLDGDVYQQLAIQAQQNFAPYDSAEDVNVQPIFLNIPLQWRFDKNIKINNLVVSNNVFILHLNEKTLQRRCFDEIPKDARAISAFTDVQIPDVIHKVFLDPNGRLVLVSTREKREVYILVSSTNSLKLNKRPIKFGNNTSFVLASVSWCNRFLQQNDTVALVAGQDGSIYEVLIRPDGELLSCNEVYPSFKSIINGNRDGVTGIYCDVKASYEDNKNVFVVITTQKALYYFEQQIDPSRKSDYFSSFFGFFRDTSLSDLKYREYPGGTAHSEIQLYVKRKPSSQILCRQFAWITGAGLFYTEINPMDVQNSFLERNRIIDYYIDKQLKQKDEEKPPKSIALTEFHCLMMFPNENQIRAVCTVNQKIVMIDGSMANGKPVCYARDQMTDQLWACTEERVLRYTITDERRDVWRVFMDKKDFQQALETCVITNDPKETRRRQRLINSKHAEHLFDQKKYSLSACIYAMSDTPFEDVTLKFFALRDKEPLREYLQSVLQTQKPVQDSTQITILTLWLTDLFLNELDELRLKDSPVKSTPALPARGSRLPIDHESTENVLDEKRRKEKFDEVRHKFQSFLRKPEIQLCLKEHSLAMYDLLTSHGDLDDLILFAEHVQDYERVILLYLEREDYIKALKTLEPLTTHELLYKYSPVLIEKLPKELIDLWKKKYIEHIDSKELLPAMITYSRAYPEGKLVLGFLKYCLTKGCIDKSIHNYLLLQYCKFDRDEIESYLKEQKEDLNLITYDPRYALRLCIDNDLKKESVFLYRLLNMHEEAVDTALQVDVPSAKECASTALINDEQRKKLWLKIAKHVVTKGKDLNGVMDILEECGNDLLKVEDILPLFPDFDTIDQFKKPIIQSLDHYNDRLTDLRTEMDDASKSIDSIRDDLAKYRTRCVATIDSECKCSLCDQALMLQSTFYIFACGHYFHSDCLFTYVRRLMNRKYESSIDEVSRAQASATGESTSEQNKQQPEKTGKKAMTLKDIDTVNRLKSILASGIAPPSRDMESVQQELDDLVAAQCVLCGEAAVDCIDQPLDALI